MPIYRYQVITDPPEDGALFDVFHAMSDAPLSHHPETGEPVRRVLTPPNLVLNHGEARERDILSDRNLSEKGFARYEKSGDGTYTRTAGKGPDTINRP